MADSKANWLLLRRHLIGFMICLLVAGAMIGGSFRFRENMERIYEQHHSRFRGVSAQYLAVDEEERIIRDFYPEFVRLYNEGLVGQERRLSWIETLRAAGDAIGVPAIGYKIEARHAVVPDFPLDLASYSLDASTMKLTLGLLHEGDLLQLLQMLERDARGHFTVRECALSRAREELTGDPTAANINADCTLEWLTLNLSSGKEIKL